MVPSVHPSPEGDPAASEPTPPEKRREILASAQREAAKADSLAVSDTKLAACLDALGFNQWTCDPVQDANTGRTVVEFLFTARSQRPEFKALRLQVAKAYVNGSLAAAEPMHPLCVMMRGQHNYNRMIELQEGTAMRLVVDKTSAGQMTTYRHGQEMEAMKLRGAIEQIDDLCLASALAGVGIPTLQVTGPAGHRRYGLPASGFVLKDAQGQYREHATAHLIRRAPTPQDPFRLALEDESPLHPVCLVYDALFARARLRKVMAAKTPHLMLQDGRLKALVTANHTGRVMDQLTQRFGAPPL